MSRLNAPLSLLPDRLEKPLRRMLWDQVPRNHRQESGAFRRRQVVAVVVVIVGGAILGWSLRLDPGDPVFYGATLALAAVWTVGSFGSGPLHLGRVERHSNLRRPILGPVLLGLALALVFVVGALVVRQVPLLEGQVNDVLGYAQEGVTPILLAITFLNGVAEELFFRGAAYAAVPRHPVAVTTVAYALTTLATGNPMLVFAALLLGLVVGLERRASGGLMGPILTHVTWSTTMLLTLPLIF